MQRISNNNKNQKLEQGSKRYFNLVTFTKLRIEPVSLELFSSDAIADLNIKESNLPVHHCLNSLCDIGKCGQGLDFNQMHFFFKFSLTLV